MDENTSINIEVTVTISEEFSYHRLAKSSLDMRIPHFGLYVIPWMDLCNRITQDCIQKYEATFTENEPEEA